jgi:hypothetical protein
MTSPPRRKIKFVARMSGLRSKYAITPSRRPTTNILIVAKRAKLSVTLLRQVIQSNGFLAWICFAHETSAAFSRRSCVPVLAIIMGGGVTVSRSGAMHRMIFSMCITKSASRWRFTQVATTVHVLITRWSDLLATMSWSPPPLWLARPRSHHQQA